MKRRTYKFFLMALALAGLAAFCGLRSSVAPSQAQTTGGPQSDAAAMTCPKCKGAMDEGMIRDYWNTNSFDPTYWSPAGEKQHLFSYGKRIKITVYRCTNCGYLESYAR